MRRDVLAVQRTVAIAEAAPTLTPHLQRPVIAEVGDRRKIAQAISTKGYNTGRLVLLDELPRLWSAVEQAKFRHAGKQSSNRTHLTRPLGLPR